MKDLANLIVPAVAVPPQAVSDNTAVTGEIIDVAGYESVTFAVLAGTLSDTGTPAAAFTVLLEESDDSGMSGATAVSDADMIGTEALASFEQTDDDEAFKLGYVGSKRYVRLTVTPTNNGSDALIAAACLLGHPANRPTLQRSATAST